MTDRPARTACTTATARARRTWSITVSACRRRSTTGRSSSRNSNARCARRCSCRPRPADYEKHACRPGGRAGGASDRPRRSADRGAAGAHAGGRPDVARSTSACKMGERVLVTTLTKRMAEQLTEYLARARRQGALSAQRHRYGGAGRDHPRPAAGHLRRAGRHQPAARRPGYSRRCRWWRSSTRTRKAFCARSAR